jgi:uncharacterized protein (DUF427 family)
MTDTMATLRFQWRHELSVATTLAHIGLDGFVLTRFFRRKSHMTFLARENVENYPRPPAVEAVAHRITIRLGGELVAETTRAVRVLETYHAPAYYLPPADVFAVLRPSQRNSFCEWKGQARYFDVSIGDTTAACAAWTYDDPTARFSSLAGYLAFYAGLMDEICIGNLRVMPQPGDFYGGWVTQNLDGRIKGAPGTRHW